MLIEINNVWASSPTPSCPSLKPAHHKASLWYVPDSSLSIQESPLFLIILVTAWKPCFASVFFSLDIYLPCPLSTGRGTQFIVCLLHFYSWPWVSPFCMESIKSPLGESSLSQNMMDELCHVGLIKLRVIEGLEIPKCVIWKCCPLSLLEISNGFLLFFPLPPTSVSQNKLCFHGSDRGSPNSQLCLEQGNYNWRKFLLAAENRQWRGSLAECDSGKKQNVWGELVWAWC